MATLRSRARSFPLFGPLQRQILLLVSARHHLATLVLLAFVGNSFAQRKPAPAECLTPGCSKLTVLYSLGGAGMSIANAARGKTTYQFQDKSAPIANAADATGYVALSPQVQQKLAGDCYDAGQHPAADQMALLRGIVAQLKRNYYAIPTFYWTVIDEASRANCLNSSANAEFRIVFFYSVMGKALSWDRDAIASVMAHEMGHIVDKYCIELGQNISPGAYQTPLGQICEKHADNIGIQYVLGAGFNPLAFVITFQTLQKYMPTQKAERYSANHPINQDRITNVGLALKTLCDGNIPEACKYTDKK
jgi:hypothetical protein